MYSAVHRADAILGTTFFGEQFPEHFDRFTLAAAAASWPSRKLQSAVRASMPSGAAAASGQRVEARPL